MTAHSIYAQHALAQAPRLLSLLDREPASASYGSFDREHWAWKFRDFPLGMQQTAVYPLALLWRHPFPQSPYHRNPRLLEWIASGIEQTLSRQHPNGAFDAFAPYEQDPGPTLGVLHGMCEAFRLVGAEFPAPLRERFRGAVRRACDFALRREEQETHAFISNHWALFAVTYLDAHELLADARYRQRASRVVDRILREQSPDGWYNEYGGPDPGYESLGIHHLATYWQRTRSTELLDSLRRAVEFFAHCVHPDGSVGGVYGSRHTALYFPGGFEILAGEMPLAAAVARFIGDQLASRNVLTPSVSDAENLPSLMYSYLEAALACCDDGPKSLPSLPCQSFRGVRYFPASGIAMAGTPHYYAVVNASKGGVCRVFDKHSAHVAYEDAGYVLRASDRQWTSQRRGLSTPAQGPRTNEVTSTASFAETVALLPSPAKYLLLRILNLTLFRSPALGNWFRDRIIARLITPMRRAPIELHRSIVFEDDSIRFSDRLGLLRPLGVQEVALPRSFTGIHMGSAKYFHPNELESTPAVPVDHLARELNREHTASVHFALNFREGAPPELLTGPRMNSARPLDAEVLSRP